ALVGEAVERGAEEFVLGAAVVLDESEGHLCSGGDGSHGDGVEPAAGQEALAGLHDLGSARRLRHQASSPSPPLIRSYHMVHAYQGGVMSAWLQRLRLWTSCLAQLIVVLDVSVATVVLSSLDAGLGLREV